MNEDLKDILSNSNKDIDNQKLMDYISGRLSGDEKHEMEKLLVDSEFMGDAMQGLEQFKNKKDVASFVEQLNADLQKQLEKKKRRKQKRKLKDQPWVYMAIILVLLLIVVSYLVIKQLAE